MGGSDAEALGQEREEYPDPGDYPLPDPNEPGLDPREHGIADGETPDADLQVEKTADEG